MRIRVPRKRTRTRTRKRTSQILIIDWVGLFRAAVAVLCQTDMEAAVCGSRPVTRALLCMVL